MSETNSGSSSAPRGALPANASIEYLRKLAKERLKSLRESKPEARLYETQLALAREYGFTSWRALAASLNESSEERVRREGERVWIDGVDKLGWGKWGPTTYAGAMASALKIVGPAYSYTTLMGDSGLAFRMRWWVSDDGTVSCPSSPVGEMHPWTDLLEESVGWKMRWDVHLEEPSDKSGEHLARLKEEIVDSIDAGLPILCYPAMLDMGICYGYEAGGDRLLTTDYYAGEKEHVVELGKTRGLFAFFDSRSTVPERKASVLRGIGNALHTWAGPSSFYQRMNKPGQYYTGAAAFEKWIDQLRRCGSKTEEQQRNLFHVSYWVFIILHEARQQAGAYLSDAKKHFEGGAADSIDEAAAIYADIGARTAPIIAGERLFMPFYRPEMFARWNDEIRREEVAVIEGIARDEARAIGHLARAAR